MESVGKIFRYLMVAKGKVQGVFYRENVKKKAEELGLTGWVRNKDMDKVEILAEGEKIYLDKLYQYCKDNPGQAKVSDVEVSKEEATEEFNEFSIRY